MYIHCTDGQAVTGVVVACLRRLQCWKMDAVITEYERRVDDVEDVERKWIQRWTGDDLVVAAAQLPRWMQWILQEKETWPKGQHPLLCASVFTFDT